MRELILMCGLPRSGKSTKCREHWRARGYVIVNPDTIRLVYHGQQFIPEEESNVWLMVRVFIQHLMRFDYDIVLDATNCTLTERNKWARLAKEHGYDVTINVMRTPMEECIARNVGEGAVPEEAITKRASKFAAPTEEEGRIIYD